MFTSFLYRMDGPHFVTLVTMAVLKWLNFSSTMGLKLTCLLKLVFHVNILLATSYFKFYTCRQERVSKYETKVDRLLQRDYKHKQVLPHINCVKFNQRWQILFRQKPKDNKKKISLCHAHVICPFFEARCFAECTILKHKFPISLPHPKQFFNCRTKNVIYLVICTTPGCRAQYVGYHHQALHV